MIPSSYNEDSITMFRHCQHIESSSQNFTPHAIESPENHLFLPMLLRIPGWEAVFSVSDHEAYRFMSFDCMCMNVNW